jgi:tetratricopeptide (TPR) repeat protein
MTIQINPTAIYERLMKVDNLSRLPDAKALQYLGTLIDLAADFDRDDGYAKAFTWCDELEQRPLVGQDVPLLDYFRANAWHNRQRRRHREPDLAWSWDQPEAIQQISCLRRSIRRPEFADLDAFRQSQIFTNLGSQLNSLGRFVEAIPMWRRALSATPNFGMALGNLGMGLSEYGRCLYDDDQREAFFLSAHRELSAALSGSAEYVDFHGDEAKAAFASRRSNIERTINVARVEKSLRLDAYAMGETREERDYRQWALANSLFLNPLNDLGPHPVAARDTFGLPSFTTTLDEPPTLIGLFNQMKQEYVSARWMLYDGIEKDATHFSDHDVTLYNTLDYPSYSVSVEKTKAAFRIAYSLFDKIAFFWNDYAKLNVAPKSVYFRSIWFSNPKRGILHESLSGSRNWPLRGLFWLSKDLFDPELEGTAEPDAQQLYVIRNCLEHSYLKVHEMLLPGRRNHDQWNDRLAYSVQRGDFERKTLRVLRLARAGLIYLSLAMHQQEEQRPKTQSDLIMPMLLDLWKDEWKM